MEAHPVKVHRPRLQTHYNTFTFTALSDDDGRTLPRSNLHTIVLLTQTDLARGGANPDKGEAQMLWSPTCIVSRLQYSPVRHNARFSAYHLRAELRIKKTPGPPPTIGHLVCLTQRDP